MLIILQRDGALEESSPVTHLVQEFFHNISVILRVVFICYSLIGCFPKIYTKLT